jgi:carboxylate-amine ligase
VEEELLLVDPVTGVAVNRADEVVAVAREVHRLDHDGSPQVRRTTTTS